MWTYYLFHIPPRALWCLLIFDIMGIWCRYCRFYGCNSYATYATYALCFFLITSFIASLSHYCKYFFFSHLWSAIILAFVLFIISCFVLSCILTFLFFLSPTYSIRICSRFPHFLFSLLFVGLYVILLRSWCSCGFSLFVLLIFFLLFFYGHYTSCYGKASLLYCTVILYCILWLAGYVTVSPS